jgi:high-affinity Fe2+/Pb2+ permease
VELPAWVSLGVWLAGVAWLTWKMPRTLAGWLFSMATSWLIFFLVGKQAFINYYYFISFTLLLAVAASPQEGVSVSEV